ncbi:hypothetical protein CGZ80_22180 [Rhodopirellula sp. MGV]|nr:hypothetical protein CGZ80_22180 [Rhodopirellula sp. MGV]PNY35211.1 hypothetical protein C2E31_19330 [Rhodopirellula baltica]
MRNAASSSARKRSGTASVYEKPSPTTAAQNNNSRCDLVRTGCSFWFQVIEKLLVAARRLQFTA